MKTKKLILTLVFLSLGFVFITSCNLRNKKIEIKKSDIPTFENWLKELSSSNEFREEIKALNFGLFEMESGYGIYLIGSKYYDSENENWATNEDFVPNNKYYYFNQTEKLKWNEFELIVTERISNFLNEQINSNSIFNSVDHITIGFDDGNLNTIK